MERSTEAKTIYELPKRQAFMMLCLATLALLFVKKSMIENETAAFEFLADQPEGSILYMRSAAQYLSIPIIYAMKFTILGLVIWMGCFLFGYRVTYSQCWGVVTVAELVFLIPELIKVFWFLVVESDPTFFEVQAFYPLSLINFFDFQSLDTRYSYPLKAINVFEPLYWFVLARGIAHFARRGMKPAWTIVLGFYVPVYVVWLVFYMIVYR